MKTYLIRFTKEELEVLRRIVSIGCDTVMACREVYRYTQERLWKAKGRVDMPIKSRVGSECKMVNCVRYKYYSAWAKNLGRSALNYCMNCKHAHVSQYERKEG